MQLNIGKWQRFYLDKTVKFVNKSSINIGLNNFWNQIMTHLPKDQIVLVLLKMKPEQSHIISLGYLNKITPSDLELLKNIYQTYLSVISKQYYQIPLESLYLDYLIVPKDKLEIIKQYKKEPLNITTFDTNRFYGWNLPNSMDMNNFGTVLTSYDNITTISVPRSLNTYRMTTLKDYTKVELLVNNKVVLSFTDHLDDPNNLGTFTRKIENQTYIFKDGKEIVRYINKKTTFIKSIKTHSKLTNLFLTMDIETRVENSILIPYCISIYDGSLNYSFYASDYNKDSTSMIKEAMSFLLQKKYHNYVVYFHNFSNFDGIFLLNILTNFNHLNIKPLIKDGQIMNIKITYGKYVLNLRDSYLLLPASLNKLADCFNVQNKGIFPYHFVNDSLNPNVDLNYTGKVPSINYFNNISEIDYIKYSNLFKGPWSLKLETIAYCNQDCIILYNIIQYFNKYIYDLFQLNIHKFITLSSLALAIYKSHFLNNYKIPIINEQMYTDIKQSYTGGATDIYKPHGNKLYRYDVNSLYPYIMKHYPMPVGKITQFEGDITKVNPNAFGFFVVAITAPDNLNIPILQTKYNNKTVAPLGKWIDILWSLEIENAKKFGYKFHILRGYIFEKEYIFKDYVDQLYTIKKTNSKNTPLYLISKLLLNSLYGRFGMELKLPNHIIINNDDLYNYMEQDNIKDVIGLSNDKILISFINNSEELHSHNRSVAISSAIASGARIHMSQFKSPKNSYTLYYSDTDSIDIDQPLDTKFVDNNELGAMKLEYIFDEAVYLAPKVYSATTNKEEITRIKGFKNKISFQDMKSLLSKNSSIILHHELWNKNIAEGNIKIINQTYELMTTDNKRQLVYKNNKLVNTKPLTINMKKDII